jgi:N-acetylglucosaminyldiphosphoundecaprenol N-acetyl-beta-D-mannosaminyltransferase
MIDHGKQNVLGVLVDAVDYERAADQIFTAAREGLPFPVACAPVHSVMEGFLHADHRYRMNHFGMVVPDGMPVRWALRLLHGLDLPDRVRGITLTLDLLARAGQERVGVYFYGNDRAGLRRLRIRLRELYPALHICGMEPSRFRRISREEKAGIVQRIRASGAQLTFVGLGTPLQDIWAYEYAREISMPIICIGGAFNVIAGSVPDAPPWMQRYGLEWFYRFTKDPGRLWRRYVLLNPAYLCMVALQKLGRDFNVEGSCPEADVYCG